MSTRLFDLPKSLLLPLLMIPGIRHMREKRKSWAPNIFVMPDLIFDVFIKK